MIDALSNPPGDTIDRIFYMFKVVGSFGGEWFNHEDVVSRSPLPASTLRRYLEKFVENDVLAYREYSGYRSNIRIMYRVKRKGE
jgi:hypothetical protein